MVNSEFMTSRRDGIDLTVYHCGMEICKSGHYFGPAVRDHYLIHYVLDGQGTFQVDGQIYKLKKNQGFLICPKVITFYQADTENPWTYTWIGFKGVKAEQYLRYANIHRQQPIFSYYKGDYIERCFHDMIQSSKPDLASEIRLQGLLYMLLSELVENADRSNFTKENQRDLYIKKAIQFIEMNFSREITITHVAEHLGLNRSYFSTLFKEALSVSPQEFLIKYRIDKAAELMVETSLSISEVSRSVGYNDPLAFSKIFRKIKGYSPTGYKQQQTSI